jgi:Skp family chaperone for outer membrane proteins
MNDEDYQRDQELIDDAKQDEAYDKSLREDYEACEDAFAEEIDAVIQHIQNLENAFAEYGWEINIAEYL